MGTLSMYIVTVMAGLLWQVYLPISSASGWTVSTNDNQPNKNPRRCHSGVFFSLKLPNSKGCQLHGNCNLYITYIIPQYWIKSRKDQKI